MFKSIRFKFVVIYFILVFIAMIFTGVYIIKEIDNLYINESKKELEGVSNLLLLDLGNIENLVTNKEDVKNIVDNYNTLSFRIDEEVWVIDKTEFSILATTSSALPSFLNDDFYINSMLNVLENKKTEEKLIREENSIIQLHPILNNGNITGLLFIKRDITSVYNTINKIKGIIFQVITIALSATVIIGFIISKSISEPIKNITEKVVLMSKGNFDNKVQVLSNDEIGELSETFNFLTTKLKSSIREISLEKTKLEAVVNHMTDGVIAVNNKNKIILINPKAIKLLDCIDVYFYDKFDELMNEIDSSLKFENITNEDDDWIGSKTIIRNNQVIKFNYAPYKNDEGDKTGIIFVLQDVTESERLDAMRRDFVANVSHELKTPLTSIKSYTETLMSGYVDDEEMKQNFLSVIDSESDRMTRLVKDLLELSNFDSHKIKFSYELNDYIELVNNSTKKLELSAQSKNIKINIDYGKDKIYGFFDYHRMEQVVINIISNSIKYSKENGNIYIKLEVIDNNINMSFKDNGIGIPKEDINRIFERFYRVDKARSREMGGTGLGLSIVKEIIKAHNGEIIVESEIGEGTVFTISIPLEYNEI